MGTLFPIVGRSTLQRSNALNKLFFSVQNVQWGLLVSVTFVTFAEHDTIILPPRAPEDTHGVILATMHDYLDCRSLLLHTISPFTRRLQLVRQLHQPL